MTRKRSRTALASDAAAEIVFWQSIEDSTDPAMNEAYLKRFPDGTFSDLARIKLKSLKPQ